MTGTTITTYDPGQIYLGQDANLSPLTVSSTGTVGGGICDSPGAKTEHITNDGSIFGGTDAAAAIYLLSRAIISNSGTIAGDTAAASGTVREDGNTGIVLEAGGTVRNTGLVSGGAGNPSGGGNGGAGLYVDGASKLNNSGTIQGGTGAVLGDSNNSGDGVLADAELVATNSGTIAGGAAVISFEYGSTIAGIGVALMAGGAIGNQGVILGGAGAQSQNGAIPGGIGVYLASGGLLSNAA